MDTWIVWIYGFYSIVEHNMYSNRALGVGPNQLALDLRMIAAASAAIRSAGNARKNVRASCGSRQVSQAS